MNKIKEMYVIVLYLYPDYHYGKVNFSFLDLIYEQCTSEDIVMIKKFLYNCWYYNGILWNLYTKIQENNKFLFI